MNLLAVASVIADLCGAPPAPLAHDPADAAQYVVVGDAAQARDDVRVAAIAYRTAIAADPANAHAREALAELCRADAATDDDALLAAIERYRHGELAAARASLTALAGARGGAAAGAHLFLGLIALRDHDGRTAARELEAAGADPEYADLATSLLRLARREGAISAIVLALVEHDTNPRLLPDTPPLGATTGPRETDEDVLLVATVTARPWRWLALRNVFAWRAQRALVALDFLSESAQAAAELGRGASRLAIRYDLDYDVLDRDPYLLANRTTLAYRHDLGSWALVASTSIRHRAYAQPAQAAFTGWVYAAEAGAVIPLGLRAEVEARAIGWRELTADRGFADVAGGGQLTLRVRPLSRVRISLAALGWGTRYDAPAPDGGLRRDVHGEGSLDIEIDLGDHLIALAGTSVLANDSTIEDFRYAKLVARCGLAFAFGAP